MRFLALDRPLAVFDIESTGLNPRTDRILELAVVRLEPGGGRTERRWLLDPGVPIPAESTAVHGITDETVRGAPRFEEKAAEILAFFRDCDLGGFGLSRLDVPILEEEFARCGMFFNAGGRRLVDALRVYHRREPRYLAAEDPSFLRWIARSDFPLDTRRIASDALAGRLPECPFPE